MIPRTWSKIDSSIKINIFIKFIYSIDCEGRIIQQLTVESCAYAKYAISRFIRPFYVQYDAKHQFYNYPGQIDRPDRLGQLESPIQGRSYSGTPLGPY
jgi:hypothetical protein